MLLRAIAARSLLSSTIAALTAAVVAGTVVAVGFSRLTAVSEGSAGALVLLGLVALGSQAAEAVRRRQHDLALARLRGRSGARLLVYALAEPTVVVVCGAAVGVAAGDAIGRVAVSAWLPSGTTFALTSREWAAVAIVAGASLLVIAVVGWQLLRAPLLDQLAAAGRPRTAGTGALFLQLVLVVGAVVAGYQAHQDARSRVDWVSLVSPAVVGLAAAQILLWLASAVFAALVRRGSGAQLGWFLTVRRLLRRADSLALIRIVIAAGVVLGVAASASTASGVWRQDRAKLQVGAPVSYPVAGGALRAYAAAHHADPKGDWLLPVAAYTTDSSGGARRVFVDAARWKPVVGDFFSDTGAAPLTAALQNFPPPPPWVFLRGGSASVTVTSASLRRAHGVRVVLQYVDDAGNLAVLDIPLRGSDGVAVGAGRVRFTESLRDCRLSCNPVELDVSGYTRGPIQIADVSLAGRHLLAPASGFHLSSVPEQFLTVRRTGAGLAVTLEKAPFFLGNGNDRSLGTFHGSSLQPAVSTPNASFVAQPGPPSISGVDGSPRQVRVVARVPVLPFVGTSGTVADLAAALRGAGGSIPSTEAAVLARSDTPSSVLASLRATGAVGRPTTYSAALSRFNQTPRAQGTRLYLIIAGFAALIALLALAAAVVQQRPERRLEAASLRSVGVSARQVASAYRREALLLAVATFVGTAVACWVCCRVLLGALPLVSGWAFAPPLDTSPRLGWIALTSVVAGLVVAGTSYAAFRRVGSRSAPRLLREEIG